MAVRNSVGIFDISHMGRVLVTGKDSERLLNYVITNNVSDLPIDSAQYSVMCNFDGGILDDFVLYRLGEERFLIVFNAMNREKDYKWVTEHAGGFDVEIEDTSDEVAMFAVQGPNAGETLQKICNTDLGTLGRFRCQQLVLGEVPSFISRTGYTGEDGFEVFAWDTSVDSPENALRLWGHIVDAGQAFNIHSCGLAARDTLRLEAGLCLYGNDIDETTTPLEARLRFVVKFEKQDFIGKEALVRQKSHGVGRRRVGIKMKGRTIPRQGFKIFDENGIELGNITSGTFSPLLKCGIGLGYVREESSKKGTPVRIEIRNRLVDGEIVSLPFYDTRRFGYRREHTQVS